MIFCDVIYEAWTALGGKGSWLLGNKDAELALPKVIKFNAGVSILAQTLKPGSTISRERAIDLLIGRKEFQQELMGVHSSRETIDLLGRDDNDLPLHAQWSIMRGTRVNHDQLCP
jgi:hypothetical protein